MNLKTPIVLVIFNRPEKIRKVIEAVRYAQPREIFVIADGARENSKSDADGCKKAREVIETIDWNCRIYRNYSNYNMGCSRRVSSGLDWVFENVGRAIILEDDCVPDDSFFYFCETLLEKYREDNNIFSISGQNVQLGQNETSYDYYFSRYAHSWGWATWRRAWKHFDYDMVLWPEIKRNKLLERILGNKRYADSWEKTFDYVLAGKGIDTWDYRWIFACWMRSGLSIIPSVNLVSNIGAGVGATHMTQQTKYSEQKSSKINFPLKHPPYIARDLLADNFTQDTLFHYHPPTIVKAWRKIKRICPFYAHCN